MNLVHLRAFPLVLIGAAVLYAPAAHAQSQGVTISDAGSDYRNFTASPSTGAAGFGPITVGDRFTAANPFVLSGLGYYDPFGVNLTAPHEVGLFLVTTDPVTGTEISTQVADASVSNTAPLSSDDFRFVSLAVPVALLPGTYDLAGFTNGDAAMFSTDAFFLANPTAFSTASGFTLTGARANFAPTFTAPNLSTGDVAYFGPNLQIAAAPEPSALTFWGTLLSSGGLHYACRRTRKA